MAIMTKPVGGYKFEGPARIRVTARGVDGGGLSIDNALRWVKQSLFTPKSESFKMDIGDIKDALDRITSKRVGLEILLETPENQKLLRDRIEPYLQIDELKDDARKALDTLFPPAAAPATPATPIQAPAVVLPPIMSDRLLELAEARSAISQLRQELIEVKARADLLVHAKNTAETEARLAKQDLERAQQERDDAVEKLESGRIGHEAAVSQARREEEDLEVKLRDRLSFLESTIESQKTRISVLEGDAIAADQNLKAAEGRETELKARITQLENENADLRSQNAEELASRIARLEGELAAAEHEIRSLAGQNAILGAVKGTTTLRGMAPIEETPAPQTIDAARLYLDEQMSRLREIGLQMNEQEEGASRSLVREQAVLKGLTREKRVVVDEIIQRQAQIKGDHAANRGMIEAEREAEISKHKTTIFANMSEAWGNLALDPMDMGKRLTDIYGDPITEEIMLRYQAELLKSETELASRIKLLEERKQGITARADAMIAAQGQKIESAQAALKAISEKLSEATEIGPIIAALRQGVENITARIDALTREFIA